jgi:hypothetical protein
MNIKISVLNSLLPGVIAGVIFRDNVATRGMESARKSGVQYAVSNSR